MADCEQLALISKKLRQEIITMTNKAGSGHPGGSLSALDILVFLYFNVMRVTPSDPSNPERDRFILSKGHCAPALYVVLAEKGFFPEDELYTLREVGSRLQGHPDMNKTPGVDITTGSLGMGLSFGVGMALGAKLDRRGCNIYVMAGDGEMQSGQIWEAVLTAGNHKLDNLTLLIDRNGFQCDGRVDDICSLGDVSAKLKQFKFFCLEADGHDFRSIEEAFYKTSTEKDRPKAIVFNTVKGKGISFMENNNHWHGSPPDDEQCHRALSELR